MNSDRTETRSPRHTALTRSFPSTISESDFDGKSSRRRYYIGPQCQIDPEIFKLPRIESISLSFQPQINQHVQQDSPLVMNVHVNIILVPCEDQGPLPLTATLCPEGRKLRVERAVFSESRMATMRVPREE